VSAAPVSEREGFDEVVEPGVGSTVGDVRTRYGQHQLRPAAQREGDRDSGRGRGYEKADCDVAARLCRGRR
jgi:hypothetical protein